MKTYLKIIASILLVILVIGDVYGILHMTWQAPVSIRIGELTPRSADISLRCSPPMIVYGETTSVSGQLRNATSSVGILYQTLDLYYRSYVETSWIYITSVSTAFDGSFSYYWSGSASLAPGFYVVNATFPGNGGFDVWSSRADLRVVIVPPPPNLATPGSSSPPGEEMYTLRPTFNWNSVPGADEYGLYIRDMDSNVLVFDSQARGRTITGTSYTLLPGILQWGGQYRWNMNSHNEAGWGEYCSPLYFYVAPEPPRDTTPPTCAITLQNDSVGISEVDVGKLFDIYVGDSTDDTAIVQVRFSSDDSQDDLPTGTWANWCDWSQNSGGWSAFDKTMKWSFATGGSKEVWAMVKDSAGNVAWNHTNIFVHPGYAIIVAGQGKLISPGDKHAIDHAANNAYRVLRNLGFDDDHIFYLNSKVPQDVDKDGNDEVDSPALLFNFISAMLEVKTNIGDNPVPPIILYLVGHGSRGELWEDPDLYFFEFVPGGENEEGPLPPSVLDSSLSSFPEETRKLIVIGSCHSGGFITTGSGTISASNRIIITAAHNDQIVGYPKMVRCSDRFWGNLNKGLNVKDAFNTNALPLFDSLFLWLDDNGDRCGHAPKDLEDDGELATATKIGMPGTENLPLTPWTSVWKGSPGELRAYDSQNRTTGLVNGVVKEEIPDSMYDEEDEIVAIFSSYDAYRYEIAGTELGAYGLDVASIEDGNATIFTAIDIPTSTNAVHQYIIDWGALSLGEEGVTVQVDSDGDGLFELKFMCDSELTRSEFDFFEQALPWQLSSTRLKWSPVVDFAIYDNRLFAAAAGKLGVYQEESWSTVDSPTYVTSLKAYENKLIIGGQGGLYYYDGATFNLIFLVPTYIRILGIYNGTLYAGTMLDNPPKLYYCTGSADNPANWHLDTGFLNVLNFTGPFGSIDSFSEYNGALYITSGGAVYLFDGTGWSIAMTYDDVYAYLDMKVYNGKLYLATRDQGWRKPMYLGGSGFSGRVIEFDGENWTIVLDHDYWVYSLETYDNKLYAGTANKILIYNGTDWSTSFNASEGAYYAISFTVFDGKIYVGMGNGYIFADPVSAR